MRWVRSLLLAVALLLPGAAGAQVGCVPNPNLNGPPFKDGCPLPAAGLNKGFAATAKALQYTCKGDGTDAAGIQALLSSLAPTPPALSGGEVQLVGNVPCLINAPLTITGSQIGLTCAGYSEAVNDSYVLPACTLKWTGAPGGTLLSIVAPSGAPTNQVIFGNFIRGINFDGNAGAAANGLVIQSVRDGVFAGLHFVGFNGGNALDLNVVQATPTNFSVSCDSQFNQFQNIAIDQRNNYTSNAIRLGGWLNNAMAQLGCNASFNNFTNTDIWGSPGMTNILLDGADNNFFLNTRSVLGGIPIDFSIHTQAGGLAYPANTNTFFGFSAPSTGASIIARGTTTFPACVPYEGGSNSTKCTYGNTIYQMDAGNGGGGVIPLQEPGANLYYKWSDDPNLRSAGVTTLVGCTGIGSTGTCTLDTGAHNEVGDIAMNPGGTGVATSGQAHLQLGGYVGQLRSAQSPVVCLANLTNGNGGWAQGATVAVTNMVPTSPYVSLDLYINYSNNGVTLPTSAPGSPILRLSYICMPMNAF